MSIENSKLMNLADGKVLYDDLRDRMQTKAPAIENYTFGALVSFADGADGIPLQKCIVHITPMQEGTGDPSPSNIRSITGRTGINITKTGKNFLTTSGIAWRNGTGEKYTDIHSISSDDLIPTYPGDKFIYFRNKQTNENASLVMRVYDENKNYIGNGPSMTYDQEGPWGATVPSNGYFVTFTQFMYDEIDDLQVQVEHGTNFTEYEETSFIEKISVDWESEIGTAYGGTFDTATGELIITDANIQSYNGEALPFTWISDRDVYIEGTMPTIGAQVVYKLATPMTRQIAPVKIKSLKCTNLWSDGNMDVEYIADTKSYVDEHAGGGDPTEIIDDEAGAGETNKVWSADKSASEIADKQDAPAVAGTAGQVLGLDSNLDPVWVNQQGGGGGAVQDVQVNGTSILSNGVANVPVAGANTVGAVAVNSGYGVAVGGSNNLYITEASSANIKGQTGWYNPITSHRQHEAVFYGLAKAAGDSTQESSSNTVGNYTDDAKAAIQSMLGIHNVEVVRLA